MIQQILAIWSLVPLLFEEMQRMGSRNPFLKIPNYPKTCSTSFPGAQSASLSTLNTLQGMSKVNSYRCNLCRGRWQMPLLFSRSVSDSLWPNGLHHARLPSLHHLPELAQTHVYWVGDAIQPSLSSPSLPVFHFPRIMVFSNESVFCIRWPKYWSFSLSISSSSEYSGLISFRIDWFDLLVVQGTLKSLLQHYS